jgi:hypothetical protein
VELQGVSREYWWRIRTTNGMERINDEEWMTTRKYLSMDME